MFMFFVWFFSGFGFGIFFWSFLKMFNSFSMEVVFPKRS